MPPRAKRKRSLDDKQEKKNTIQQPRSFSEACVLVISQMRNNPLATPFNQPVTDIEAPQYSQVVKNPMDLGTIYDRAKKKWYSSPQELKQSVDSIWIACEEYNGLYTPLTKSVTALQRMFNKLYKDYLVCWENGQRPNLSSSSQGRSPSDLTSPENKKKLKLVFKMGSKVSLSTSSSSQAVIHDEDDDDENGDNDDDMYEEGDFDDDDDGEGTGSNLSDKASRSAKLASLRKAAREARAKFKSKPNVMPFVSSDYRVMDWGVIKTDNTSFITKDFIFPVGFKSCFMFTHSNNHGGKLLVEYLSEIKQTAGRPQFTISASSNAALIATSLLSPQDAWNQALKFSGQDDRSPGVRLTQRRLTRCQAVLNWMAYRPGCDLFWDPVDETVFDTYRQIVSKPICLSQIQHRLSTNQYFNEFEFANEIRLVYANCQVFNEDHSSLWTLANELVKQFDILFCDWVLNTSPVENIRSNDSSSSSTSSEKKKKKKQSVHSVDGEVDEAVSLDCKGIGWEKWQQMNTFSYDTTERIPGPSKPTISGKVAKGVNLGWEPTSGSLPAGWMQAFKAKHARLVDDNDEDQLPGSRTNLNTRELLNPFGRRCLPSERPLVPKSKKVKGVVNVKESVEQLHAQCLSVAHYYETTKATLNPSPNPTLPLDGHFGLSDIMIKSLVEGMAGAEQAVSHAFSANERRGSYEFLGSAMLMKGMVQELERKKIEREEKLSIDEAVRGLMFMDRIYFPRKRNPSALPSYLKKSALLKSISLPPLPLDPSTGESYDIDQMYSAMRVVTKDEKEVDHSKDKTQLKLTDTSSSSATTVTTTLSSVTNNVDEKEVIYSRHKPENLPNHTALSSPHHSENILMIWDFCCSFHTCLGILPISFSDMNLALTKTGARLTPSGDLPEEPHLGFASTPALHFNEIGMAFTKLLLLDLETCLQLKSDRDKREFFALKPINIITWPEIARECLSVASQYRHCSSVTSTDTMRWLRNIPPRNMNKCMEILAVLCAHPLSTPFLEPVNATEVSGYSKVVSKPMDISAVRRKIYTYEGHAAFASDVRLIWANCLAFNDAGSYLARSAVTLSEMFESLYKDWVTLPESLEHSKHAIPEPSTTSTTSTTSTAPENGGSAMDVDHSQQQVPAAVTTESTYYATMRAKRLGVDSTANSLISCFERRGAGLSMDKCMDSSKIHPSFANGVPPRRFEKPLRRSSISLSSTLAPKTLSYESQSQEQVDSCSSCSNDHQIQQQEQDITNEELVHQNASLVEDWGEEEIEGSEPKINATWKNYHEPYQPLNEGPATYAYQLAKSFNVLREIDPEDWSVDQRLNVLTLLVNELMDTTIILNEIQSKVSALEGEMDLDLSVAAAVTEGTKLDPRTSKPGEESIEELAELDYESLIRRGCPIVSMTPIRKSAQDQDPVPSSSSQETDQYVSFIGYQAIPAQVENGQLKKAVVSDPNTPIPTETPVSTTTSSTECTHRGCVFCGLTQSFSSQPWVRVPDMMLQPLDDVIFLQIIKLSQQHSQWMAKSSEPHNQPHPLTLKPLDMTNEFIAHKKCLFIMLRTREHSARAEKLRQEREIRHWNAHTPSLKDHHLTLRSLLLGRDINQTEYWMIGTATGQLLTRSNHGKWGWYDVPYRVYQLWASLDDNIPCEWILRRRILNYLTSKNIEKDEFYEQNEKRKQLMAKEYNLGFHKVPIFPIKTSSSSSSNTTAISDVIEMTVKDDDTQNKQGSESSPKASSSDINSDPTAVTTSENDIVLKTNEIAENNLENEKEKGLVNKSDDEFPEEYLEEVKSIIEREELVWGRTLEMRDSDYLKLFIEDAKRKEEEVARQEAEKGNPVTAAVKLEKKRQKEEAALEFSDFHPFKGWVRADLSSTLMSLRAETNASKLLTKNIFNPNLLRLTARPGSIQAEHGGYTRKSDQRITAAMVRGPYNKTLKKLRLNGDVTPLTTNSSSSSSALTAPSSKSPPPPPSNQQDESSRDYGLEDDEDDEDENSRTGFDDTEGDNSRTSTTSTTTTPVSTTASTPAATAATNSIALTIQQQQRKIEQEIINSGKKMTYYQKRKLALIAQAQQASLAGDNSFGASLINGVSSMISSGVHAGWTDPPRTCVSYVILSPKILKLKSELLNMISLLPYSRPKRIENLDNSSNAADGGVAMNQEEIYYEMGDGNSLVLDVPIFVEKVRKAKDCLEILDCVLQFESSIPTGWLNHWWKSKAFAHSSPTAAALGMRIYALDRAIKYSEASEDKRPNVLRTDNLLCFNQNSGWLTTFSHHCHNSLLCARCFNHGGRCAPASNNITRVITNADKKNGRAKSALMYWTKPDAYAPYSSSSSNNMMSTTPSHNQMSNVSINHQAITTHHPQHAQQQYRSTQPVLHSASAFQTPISTSNNNIMTNSNSNIMTSSNNSNNNMGSYSKNLSNNSLVPTSLLSDIPMLNERSMQMNQMNQNLMHNTSFNFLPPPPPQGSTATNMISASSSAPSSSSTPSTQNSPLINVGSNIPNIGYPTSYGSFPPSNLPDSTLAPTSSTAFSYYSNNLPQPQPTSNQPNDKQSDHNSAPSVMYPPTSQNFNAVVMNSSPPPQQPPSQLTSEQQRQRHQQAVELNRDFQPPQHHPK